jgi:protein-S-isoprenylcysteine O-methyltransferase Ste14
MLGVLADVEAVALVDAALLLTALVVEAAFVVAAPPAAAEVAVVAADEVVLAGAAVVDEAVDFAAVVAVGDVLPQAVISAPTPAMPARPERRRKCRRESVQVVGASCWSMRLSFLWVHRRLPRVITIADEPPTAHVVVQSG